VNESKSRGEAKTISQREDWKHGDYLRPKKRFICLPKSVMKIVIAMPTLGVLDIRMATFLYALIKNSKHDLSIIHTPRADICQARNMLVREFMKMDADYLLFLDDDNIPEDVGFLDRLVAADKTVVTGLVPSRKADEQGRHRLCIFKERITEDQGKHEYLQQFTIPEGPEVMKIANCGMGCVLIKRDVVKTVFENYNMPFEMKMAWYFQDGDSWVRDDITDFSKITDGVLRFQRYVSEDILFFERARDAGVEIWCHKGVRCTHI
jgi:hypothetical protein